MKLTCMSCFNEFEGPAYHDSLGWHGVCPKCKASFPVDAIDVDTSGDDAVVQVEETPDGKTVCTLCNSELVCDETGAMPETCPVCGCRLGYHPFEPEGAKGENEGSDEGKSTFYVLYSFRARFVAEVKAKTVEEAKKLGELAFESADFGPAEDIDGTAISVEDENCDVLWGQ